MNVLALLLAVTATVQPAVPPGGSTPALVVQAATPEISTSTSANVSLTYTLRNTTPEGMTLLLGDLTLEGKPRETVWRRLDSNKTVAEVELAPKSSLAMLLQAAADTPGLYVASIRPKGGSGEIGAVLLDRQKGVAKPVDILAPAAPLASSAASKTPDLKFQVRNDDRQALPLKPPFLVELSRVIDGQTPEGVPLDMAKTKILLTCKTGPDKVGLVSLAPGETCDGALQLPWLGPGVYEAKTEIGGPDGEPAAVSLKFIRRFPFCVALAIALVGSAVGAAVQWWRGTGRRRALGSEEAERLLRIARPLAATARQQNYGDLGRWIRNLEDLMHDIEAGRRDDWDLPLQAAARRLELIEWWFDREEEIRTFKLTGQPLADARAAAASTITDPEKDDAAVKQVLDDLQQAMKKAKETIGVAAELLPPPKPSGAKKIGWAILRRYRILFDRATIAITWVVASLIAVQTNWASDPAWGSLGDIITLLGVSLGIQIGGAAALATLFTPRPSPLQ